MNETYSIWIPPGLLAQLLRDRSDTEAVREQQKLSADEARERREINRRIDFLNRE